MFVRIGRGTHGLPANAGGSRGAAHSNLRSLDVSPPTYPSKPLHTTLA
jgi:hypothetical protein